MDCQPQRDLDAERDIHSDVNTVVDIDMDLDAERDTDRNGECYSYTDRYCHCDCITDRYTHGKRIAHTNSIADCHCNSKRDPITNVDSDGNRDCERDFNRDRNIHCIADCVGCDCGRGSTDRHTCALLHCVAERDAAPNGDRDGKPDRFVHAVTSPKRNTAAIRHAIEYGDCFSKSNLDGDRATDRRGRGQPECGHGDPCAAKPDPRGDAKPDTRHERDLCSDAG
jgi:hypothetical protein